MSAAAGDGAGPPPPPLPLIRPAAMAGHSVAAAAALTAPSVASGGPAGVELVVLTDNGSIRADATRSLRLLASQLAAFLATQHRPGGAVRTSISLSSALESFLTRSAFSKPWNPDPLHSFGLQD